MLIKLKKNLKYS